MLLLTIFGWRGQRLPGDSPIGTRGQHNGKRVMSIERCHGWLSGKSFVDHGILRADAARNKAAKLRWDQAAEKVRYFESGWCWRGKPARNDHLSDSVERTKNHMEGVGASRCATERTPVFGQDDVTRTEPSGKDRTVTRNPCRDTASVGWRLGKRCKDWPLRYHS